MIAACEVRWTNLVDSEHCWVNTVEWTLFSEHDGQVVSLIKTTNRLFHNFSVLIPLDALKVIRLFSDLRGRMIPAELERLVKEAIEQKKRPFFVNCTCGTTVLGKKV